MNCLRKGVDNIKLPVNKKIVVSAIVILVAAFVFVILVRNYGSILSGDNELPHEGKWGIYGLDLETEKTELVYSSANKISRVRLNNAGDKLVFYQQIFYATTPSSQKTIPKSFSLENGTQINAVTRNLIIW